MSTLQLNVNQMHTLDVTVRESDEYTETVFLKMARNYGFGKVHGCDEVFMTPTQLELFGKFLIRQAEEIRGIQKFRAESNQE